MSSVECQTESASGATLVWECRARDNLSFCCKRCNESRLRIQISPCCATGRDRFQTSRDRRTLEHLVTSTGHRVTIRRISRRAERVLDNGRPLSRMISPQTGVVVERFGGSRIGRRGVSNGCVPSLRGHRPVAFPPLAVYAKHGLARGVTVAQQILVLLVMVRIHAGQLRHC